MVSFYCRGSPVCQLLLTEGPVWTSAPSLLINNGSCLNIRAARLKKRGQKKILKKQKKKHKKKQKHTKSQKLKKQFAQKYTECNKWQIKALRCAVTLWDDSLGMLKGTQRKSGFESTRNPQR